MVCRQYRPGPTDVVVTVPLVPASLRQSILQQVHDAPGAGHLGVDKALEKARQLGYWVSMYEDVVKHCQECASCQQAKLPSPSKAPLVNVNNNRYLLVIQDYFIKVGGSNTTS